MHTNPLPEISFNTGDVLAGMLLLIYHSQSSSCHYIEKPIWFIKSLWYLLDMCHSLHWLSVFDHSNLIKMQKGPLCYILPLNPEGRPSLPFSSTWKDLFLQNSLCYIKQCKSTVKIWKTEASGLHFHTRSLGGNLMVLSSSCRFSVQSDSYVPLLQRTVFTTHPLQESWWSPHKTDREHEK